MGAAGRSRQATPLVARCAEDLQILKDMGYIEIVDDEPLITLSGMDEMNIGD